MAQIKKLRVLIDDEIEQNKLEVERVEKERNAALLSIGNLVHDSVVVSNDEVFSFFIYPNPVVSLKWLCGFVSQLYSKYGDDKQTHSCLLFILPS